MSDDAEEISARVNFGWPKAEGDTACHPLDGKFWLSFAPAEWSAWLASYTSVAGPHRYWQDRSIAAERGLDESARAMNKLTFGLTALEAAARLAAKAIRAHADDDMWTEEDKQALNELEALLAPIGGSE